jgi:predicted DNA binding CopG/RHH family protein
MRSRSDKVFQALDEEEGVLIQSIENDEWTAVPDVERFKKQARRYAEATIRKNRRMNIRISERDLRNLNKRAL